MAEYRPANGTCACCRAALGTASLHQDGSWYCSPACAAGRPQASRDPAVPAPRLYGVPRRFYRARRPKELRAPSRGR